LLIGFGYHGLETTALKINIWKLAGILLVLLTVPASAGDRAGISFIGYSTTGSYFAYEEFGIQDGSGFAYANLYVLDVNTNSWVKGTPFHQAIENETGSIASALAGVRAKARATLDKLGIGEPVDIVALNADGALDTDMRKLRFGRPGYGMADPEQDYELVLSTIQDGIDPPKCAALGEEYVSGFSLTLTVNGKAREVYRDTALPESRGCPRGYRLYAVIAQFENLVHLAPDITPGMIAIVSVYSMGFEGPDRRFIAVPIGK
jgi:predicted secreted protein